jgi:arylformamidase
LEILDVSISIRPGMITYPGDPAVGLELVHSIEDGASNVSRLDFGVHTRTHVDTRFAGGSRSAPLSDDSP